MAEMSAWFNHAPLLVIWPTLALGFLAALAVGFVGKWFIMRRRKTAPEAEMGDEAAGFILSSALALLGLLIAFTFSMAAERFEARRHLMMEQANAIGTTYLRFQLFDEPDRTRLSDLLIAYAEARQTFFGARADSTRIERADAHTGDVETQMWNVLSAAIRAHPAATSNPSILQTTNDMFDLAASDRVAREVHVPVTIIRALTIYALIAALLLGQNLASLRDRHLIGAGALLVLVALAMALILDLDRPATGSITVSTVAFDRATGAIKTMETAHIHAASTRP